MIRFMLYPVDPLNLRLRMKVSFACLVMVVRHECKRLHRAEGLRVLTPEETDFLTDCELYFHKPSLISREDFRNIVLRYFNID